MVPLFAVVVNRKLNFFVRLFDLLTLDRTNFDLFSGARKKEDSLWLNFGVGSLVSAENSADKASACIYIHDGNSRYRHDFFCKILFFSKIAEM